MMGRAVVFVVGESNRGRGTMGWELGCDLRVGVDVRARKATAHGTVD